MEPLADGKTQEEVGGVLTLGYPSLHSPPSKLKRCTWGRHVPVCVKNPRATMLVAQSESFIQPPHDSMLRFRPMEVTPHATSTAICQTRRVWIELHSGTLSALMAPPMPPAEQCCCVCSLPQGVQAISWYSVIVGALSMLSLLMNGLVDSPVRSRLEQAVGLLETLFHSLAFFAGLKGLLGVMFRDSKPLRTLLLYHASELVVRSVSFLFREADACSELRRLQILHRAPQDMTCETPRIAMLLTFVVHCATLLYFVYVVWSFIVRLQSGEFGHPGIGFEDTEAFFRHGGALEALDGAQPAGQAIQPFAGPPRSLREGGEGCIVGEAFRGEPQRLE